MGVMACSREDCAEIMVDTYITDIGYVCKDCQSEFKEWLSTQNKEPETRAEIRAALNLFMQTPRRYVDERDAKPITVDDFFREGTN